MTAQDEGSGFGRKVLVLAFLMITSLGLIALGAIVTQPKEPSEPPYAGVVLQQGVLYATARKWSASFLTWRREEPLRWLQDEGGRIRLVTEPPTALEDMSRTGDMTILVHGYRTPDKDVAKYFAEFVDYLRNEKNDARFIVYDWFSFARGWETLTDTEKLGSPVWVNGVPVYNNNRAEWEWKGYNVDKAQSGWTGAPAFAQLINVVAPRAVKKKVTVVAHSMGSRVVLEALRRQPNIGQFIDILVLLAPAVDHRALEDTDVAAALGHIGSVHVFYSRNDTILTKYARLVEWNLQLGSHGPRDASVLAKSVLLHDVTDVFGEGDDIHSRYLAGRGARAASIAEILR